MPIIIYTRTGVDIHFPSFLGGAGEYTLVENSTYIEIFDGSTSVGKFYIANLAGWRQLK